jgi:hypothetical protein
VRECSFAGCTQRATWHHPLKRQRIRGRFRHGARWVDGGWVPADRHDPVKRVTPVARTLGSLIGDERNRIDVCWDHHQLIEGDLSLLPPSVWAFAREFGLDAALENDIARQRG